MAYLNLGHPPPAAKSHLKLGGISVDNINSPLLQLAVTKSKNGVTSSVNVPPPNLAALLAQ
jgi:hypothetical protein